jgi:hypothetical protein
MSASLLLSLSKARLASSARSSSFKYFAFAQLDHSEKFNRTFWIVSSTSVESEPLDRISICEKASFLHSLSNFFKEILPEVSLYWYMK